MCARSVQDIPEHDQVRFVLRSPQLEFISLPFIPLSCLTTEQILAQIECVIQSNHEFRLNDSVNVHCPGYKTFRDKFGKAFDK